jgi:hypothetical protein
MKRWEGHTVAIATMCTASSSVSLRRTLAQFVRLPSARIEIQTLGTLSVDNQQILVSCTARYIYMTTFIFATK